MVEAGSADSTIGAVACTSRFPSTVALTFPASVDHDQIIERLLRPAGPLHFQVDNLRLFGA